jgi:hypothetical protein
MNPVLAQLYGTGFEKQASDDIDLNQISGAQLLQLLQQEDAEKTAGGFDPSHLSGRELLELYAEAEEAEAFDNQGYVLEKMAQSGELEYYDMVGRVQAHAYADEMSKLAYGDSDNYDFIDLNEIDGETMMALMEDGWEIEKTAGPKWDAIKAMGGRARDAVLGTSARDIKSNISGRLGAGRDFAMTGTLGGAASRVKGAGKRSWEIGSAAKFREATQGMGAADRAKAFASAVRSGDHDARKFLAMHGSMGAATAALGTGVAAAGVGGAALAAGGAGAYYMKKKKKGPWAKGGRFNR